ncbi:hypothetical protein IWX64_003205 [Arthrobacter sp. CAN_A212]|uniref:hypothetical protein n=1 Tax=unclassified Arthrobacter TaxID=235627 RepID=UPI0018CBD666|nr:hypothetical protein [Arthrobacter sp. CAN_C5]MBP2217911.1 hypothetical protein [Arthrobacter sp. CAN_C5]
MTATNRGATATGRTGHTRITKSALTHTAEAVAAAAFGVPRSEVRVALADDGGALGITVSAPLPAPTLLQAAQDASAVEDGGGTVFDRAAHARNGIRETAQQVTGARVGRIDIRLTGIRPPAERKLA